MGGKYQAYPEYKDSGIEWLGEVPVHWILCSFRHCLNEIFNGLSSTQIDETDDTVPVTRIETISTGVIDGDCLGFISREDARQDRKLIFGDILFSNINSLNMIGNCAIYTGGREIYAGMNLLVFRPVNSIDAKWLYWLIKSSVFRQVIESLSKPAINQASISQSSINSIGISVPQAEEQTAIANFLDHETAKIDTLIEKQQQLIKLLKEKRQAVISHAVTKGLNPNAKMRDSGVEWLGEVPEHWVVAQLKFNTLEMQTGPFGSQLHAEDYVDDGIPLINPAHMTDGKVVPDSKVSVDRETWNRLSRHQLFEGDLIFARRGELGRCAVVTKGEEGWLCGTGSLKAKLNEKLVPEYSYLLITSDGVVSELSLESKGSTMDNLNTETLGRVRLPVPPIVEQKKILNYVKEVSGKYGLLIDKASSAIELMKERRTALISAAVTGKIDVRDWQISSRKGKEVV